MRANLTILGLLLWCCATSSALAQIAPPTNPSVKRSATAGKRAAKAAPPAAPAEAGAPPAATAAPATAAAAPAEASKEAQPASAPAAAPGAPAAQADAAAASTDPQAARVMLERARLRALLAAERARRGDAAQATAEPAAQPPAVRRYGDAGAAIAIGVSFDAPWYTKRSYDLFSDKDVANRFGVWAAHDVAALRSDTFVALELGWGTEHEQDGGLRASTLGTELTTHAFYGGAQLRWVPLSWLQPHARLAAGAQLIKMQLTSSSPAVTFKDKGLTPYTSLGLGVTLRSPTRLFEDFQGHLASLSVGLMLEGGYTLAKALDLALDGPNPSNRGVPILEPKLGSLNRSGPYARASLVVRF